MIGLNVSFLVVAAAVLLAACFFARRCLTKKRTVKSREYELVQALYIEKKHCVKLYLKETVIYQSKTKEYRSTKKTVRVQDVSPASLEALRKSSDEAIRLFAKEIAEAASDSFSMPSWYLQMRLCEQAGEKQKQLEARRAAIDAEFSSIYGSLKMRTCEIACELESLENRRCVFSNEFSVLDQQLKNADRNIISRSAFLIFNSKKKRTALNDRYVLLDSRLLDINIEISSLEEEMKQCVHKMLTLAKERGEKLSTLDSECESIMLEYEKRKSEIKPLTQQ